MEYYLKEYYTKELLRICAQGCNVADMQVCITNGANINVCDDLGSTPLYFATKGGHMDAVRYLVQCGARWIPLCSYGNKGTKVNIMRDKILGPLNLFPKQRFSRQERREYKQEQIEARQKMLQAAKEAKEDYKLCHLQRGTKNAKPTKAIVTPAKLPSLVMGMKVACKGKGGYSFRYNGQRSFFSCYHDEYESIADEDEEADEEEYVGPVHAEGEGEDKKGDEKEGEEMEASVATTATDPHLALTAIASGDAIDVASIVRQVTESSSYLSWLYSAFGASPGLIGDGEKTSGQGQTKKDKTKQEDDVASEAGSDWEMVSNVSTTSTTSSFVPVTATSTHHKNLFTPSSTFTRSTQQNPILSFASALGQQNAGGSPVTYRKIARAAASSIVAKSGGETEGGEKEGQVEKEAEGKKKDKREGGGGEEVWDFQKRAGTTIFHVQKCERGVKFADRQAANPHSKVNTASVNSCKGSGFGSSPKWHKSKARGTKGAMW